MRVPIVAVAAACLAWGVASAQMGPSFAPPALRVDSPPAAPPPDARAEIWSHMPVSHPSSTPLRDLARD